MHGIAYTGNNHPKSISAYNDTVICAFESAFPSGTGIRYRISYDGGNSWGTSDFQPPSGSNYRFPALTARGGRGIALIFSEERTNDYFDFVWFRFRAGYGSAAWDEPMQINQFTVGTDMNRIQWIPGPPSYGGIYLTGPVTYGKAAYFSRMYLGSKSLPWLWLLME